MKNLLDLIFLSDLWISFAAKIIHNTCKQILIRKMKNTQQSKYSTLPFVCRLNGNIVLLRRRLRINSFVFSAVGKKLTPLPHFLQLKIHSSKYLLLLISGVTKTCLGRIHFHPILKGFQSHLLFSMKPICIHMNSVIYILEGIQDMISMYSYSSICNILHI